MHLHGALILLGWMAQVPRLLGYLDIAVPDQATVIVVIKGLQGLFDWSVCQPDGFAPGPRVLPIPRVRDHRMERIGLEGPTVVLAPKLGRPLLVLDGLPRHAHALRLQPLSLGDSALPAAAYTRASTITAMVAVAGTTPQRPWWSRHDRSVPSKTPESTMTMGR